MVIPDVITPDTYKFVPVLAPCIVVLGTNCGISTLYVPISPDVPVN